MVNVYDRDDNAMADPMTGWRPDEFPSVTGAFSAWTPNEPDTTGMSSMQKACLHRRGAAATLAPGMVQSGPI
eukprot:gene50194-21045_t